MYFLENFVTLSVVVSCYKQENYIAECLSSILAQSVNFKYEIIIADDCSPDATQKIINEFHKKYPQKITLLYQKTNIGAAKNYLAVHNLAKGKYVAHFDGDDIMLPGKLQMQVDIMENNPDCNIVFHRARYFSDDRSYISETGSLVQDNKIIFFTPQELARWGTIAVHSSYMYRRSTRKTRQYTKDFMEWFFAFESLSDGGTGAYINQVLVEYRCNLNGGAYLSSKAGRKKAYLILIDHVDEAFKKNYYLRYDLYAHQFTNILMYTKNIKEPKWYMFKFLLFNLKYFNIKNIIDTARVRKMTSPTFKIR